MGKPYIHLFDTTLRDGAQTQGIDFSLRDKQRIAHMLDTLGLDYIEGGWPGANPTDEAFFAEKPGLTTSEFVAFGMTRRPGRSASNDTVLTPILQASADAGCLVGKAWDFQVEVALGIEKSENLAMIGDSIAAVKAALGQAFYDAEHFFDGYKANPSYALACLGAAYDGGARWLVLCDTNGGTLPDEVAQIVAEVTAHFPKQQIGVHLHNDTEQAVAGSIAAIRAGAHQVQGTLNGIGERCGNTNLCTLIANLKLKSAIADEIDIGVPVENLAKLTKISRTMDELLGRMPARQAPYVGTAAFAHKGGLHASAVAKDPKTYEHVTPESVGNMRHIVVSDQSGRANILAHLKEIGITLDPADDRIPTLLEAVKTLEAETGLTFDGADASFEIFVRRFFGEVLSFYTLDRFRVIDERRWNARNELITESVAMVQLAVRDKEYLEAAKGNGPVDALFTAMRQALTTDFPVIDDIRLVDYRVRILDGGAGTAAVTRVLVEYENTAGQRWTTVGVSENIIDASYSALDDAVTWLLSRSA